MPEGLDTKKKTELAITGIGIIVLIFLLMSYLPKSKDNKPASASRVTEVSFTSLEPGASDTKTWGRDPFILDAANAKEQVMGDMTLNGIAADKENPYAIINNNIVKLGDRVNGMTVIEINEKNVVLDEKGQRHTLELNLY
jgi:hypothetical protein